MLKLPESQFANFDVVYCKYRSFKKKCKCLKIARKLLKYHKNLAFGLQKLVGTLVRSCNSWNCDQQNKVWHKISEDRNKTKGFN